MSSDRHKWYVVWRGTEPGICDSWAECELRAKLTDNYSSSDIAYIVNDAALVAAYKNIPISQQLLFDTIKANPSSLGPASGDTERRKIGFK